MEGECNTLLGMRDVNIGSLCTGYGGLDQHRALGNGVVPHQAVRPLPELVAVAVDVMTDEITQMTEGARAA